MRRRGRTGLSRVQAGALLVVIVVVVSYLGFTKAIPFREHYEIRADFRSSSTLILGSLVRIAGVNVGKVTGIEYANPKRPGIVRVTMRIDEVGRPIHRDATIDLRPRIFLEGNLFVELHPGTPTAPILKDGEVIPAANTTSPVQLHQLLNALQSDTRKDLTRTLNELSTGLSGRGGAGYNRSIQYWQPAFRGSAIVNDATLGIEPHDLSGYLRTAGQFADALDRNPPALKALISDFNTTAAALAAEQRSLEATITELPRTLRIARPALRALNSSFPPLRRLTADLRPATRSTGPTIDASLPFIAQLRALVSPSELQGAVADLREISPDLARLNDRLPQLYEEVRAASSCQNETILPWSVDKVGDPNFPATGEVYQEGVKGLPGLAAESRSGDANGQWARVLAGNGVYTYLLELAGETLPRVGLTNFPLEGVNPPKSPEPPYRYDKPCENQETPNLDTVPSPALELLADVNLVDLADLIGILAQARTFEGAAAMLERELPGSGRADRAARQLRARAQRLREKHELEGAEFRARNGRLSIKRDKASNRKQEEDEERSGRGEPDGEDDPTKGPLDAVDGVIGGDEEDEQDEEDAQP